MNLKLKFVLWFTGLRKPLDFQKAISIEKMRAVAAESGKLGKMFFDKKVAVKKVWDEMAADVAVRIYKNSEAKNQRAIVYYHGGGFVLYNPDSHDYVCRRLCAMNNCTVISVDYRLAPEHTFPAAHDDAWNTFLWVRNHAERLGVDNHNLIVAGDSAGGNLSACVAHRCLKNNISLRAQVLVYPWIDGKLINPSISRNGEGYLLTKDAMYWFQQKYTPNEKDRCVPEVSPCYETNFKGLAAAMILTAEFDPLLDDGFLYAKQLEKEGVDVLYKEYKGLVHGFFNIPLVANEAMQSYQDIKDFLEKI